MAKMNITKKELSKVYKSVAFKEIESFKRSHTAVVIPDNADLKETKKHYGLLYDKADVVVIRKKDINKQNTARAFRGRTVDNLILQTALSLNQYKTLMGYVGNGLLLNDDKERSKNKG